ncbi:MAG: hypothetical protein KC680_00860 [Candidatus Peregrinibacteria bacterium]|nr:hypothetical protein [Candidatus Peregrinibacteria bacterium]MCB9807807.1 hypothetical protein [Candidatus Peribacteria bacterium]
MKYNKEDSRFLRLVLTAYEKMADVGQLLVVAVLSYGAGAALVQLNDPIRTILAYLSVLFFPSFMMSWKNKDEDETTKENLVKGICGMVYLTVLFFVGRHDFMSYETAMFVVGLPTVFFVMFFFMLHKIGEEFAQ